MKTLKPECGCKRKRCLYPKLFARALALWDALEFYANPQSYHAMSFIADRPAGEFADDFSEDHGDEFYDRAMPGKRARAVLYKVAK